MTRAVPSGLLGVGVTYAAAHLGVSVGTVRRWADEGALPSFRTPGGQRRFAIGELEAFASRLRVEAKA